MKLETKYQGLIEVSEEQIIAFEKGIPAFESEMSFVLLPFEEGTPFYVLQSTKTPEVAFIVISPFDFVTGYQVKLPDSTLEMLEIEQPDDVATFVMLTVKDPFQDTTANLQAPVIINSKKQKGKQLLLSDGPYKTRHAIFKEPVTSKEEK
ncbi:flagellar assembly factor FliW [Halalkalibacter wakoensis JCM 9140]|uniref:Flagellar assembly factor FliW n=1 Tax=Halalkalibacter wakoensis JCM 9140 TaxID=1236970 RepID=W4Q3J4_9BACI|nr:flagellar assembly protein FliW [Halalkalibacter wakoensis]GAE26515.1 flagellar assembly factor FliW [Halalkalibacter wakoensis JCM 9140]